MGRSKTAEEKRAAMLEQFEAFAKITEPKKNPCAGDIAQAVGMGVTVGDVRKLAKEVGFPLTPQGRPPAIPYDKHDGVITAHEKGVSKERLAKDFGVNVKTIMRILDRDNRPATPPAAVAVGGKRTTVFGWTLDRIPRSRSSAEEDKQPEKPQEVKFDWTNPFSQRAKI